MVFMAWSSSFMVTPPSGTPLSNTRPAILPGMGVGVLVDVDVAVGELVGVGVSVGVGVGVSVALGKGVGVRVAAGIGVGTFVVGLPVEVSVGDGLVMSVFVLVVVTSVETPTGCGVWSEATPASVIGVELGSSKMIKSGRLLAACSAEDSDSSPW